MPLAMDLPVRILEPTKNANSDSGTSSLNASNNFIYDEIPNYTTTAVHVVHSTQRPAAAST